MLRAVLREKMLEDFQFLVPGNQWPQSIRNERALDGRPALEVDRLTPAIKQVVNQQRQLRPGL